jgi:hypothetical protein
MISSATARFRIAFRSCVTAWTRGGEERVADRLKRLRDLVIDRVSFVASGDNPGATIELWKAQRPEGGVMRDDVIKRAADATLARATSAHETASATLERAKKLGAPAAKGRGAVPVAKTDAETELARWSEKLALERGIPEEQAFTEIVTKTARGRRLVKAAMGPGESTGVLKFRGGHEEREPTPPTRGSVELDAMAAEVAKDRKISKEQAVAAIARTSEGKALMRKHVEELLARFSA